jgi:hypothetical protein
MNKNTIKSVISSQMRFRHSLNSNYPRMSFLTLREIKRIFIPILYHISILIFCIKDRSRKLLSLYIQKYKLTIEENFEKETHYWQIMPDIQVNNQHIPVQANLYHILLIILQKYIQNKVNSILVFLESIICIFAVN